MSVLAVSLTAGLEQAWTDIARFVPRLIAAIVIFVIGGIIARIVAGLIAKGLRMVKFDQIVDRTDLKGFVSQLGMGKASDLLAKIFYWIAMIMVLQLAVDALGLAPIQQTLRDLVAFLPRIFIALIIIVLTAAVAKPVGQIVSRATSTESYGQLLTRVAVGAIWLIGGFAAVDQLGVASDVLATLWQGVVASLSLILVIKFGVGGVWAARDRFWPAVYDFVEGKDKSRTPR